MFGRMGARLRFGEVPLPRHLPHRPTFAESGGADLFCHVSKVTKAAVCPPNLLL